MRFLQQIFAGNPFKGNCQPSHVKLFSSGRPSLPFPHPWNFREPIKILESYYSGAENEGIFGTHNRYLNVPWLPHVLVTRDPLVIKTILSATGDKPGQCVCPGKFLGLLDVGFVVGAFMKMFKFTAVNKSVAARAGVLTKPSDGVFVQLRRRE